MSWTGWGDRERQGDGEKNTAIARYIFLCMHWGGGTASARRVGLLCLGSGQLPVDIVSSGVSCQWWIDKSTPHPSTFALTLPNLYHHFSIPSHPWPPSFSAARRAWWAHLKEVEVSLRLDGGQYKNIHIAVLPATLQSLVHISELLTVSDGGLFVPFLYMYLTSYSPWALCLMWKVSWGKLNNG